MDKNKSCIFLKNGFNPVLGSIPCLPFKVAWGGAKQQNNPHNKPKLNLCGWVFWAGH